MVYIYIKDGKVWDICSPLGLKGIKRDENIPDEDYIQIGKTDVMLGDTWDFENNISLKDSEFRIPKKSELEILKDKFNELIVLVNEHESKIKELEEKEVKK